MKRKLISIFRPLFRKLIHLPPVQRAIVRAAAAVSTEMNLVAEFVEGGYGAEYGVTKRDRRKLVTAFQRNCRNMESAAAADAHTILAMEVLSIPQDVRGDIIECGTFKGASAASLSLVCRAVGRRLLVCDSFQGLPAPRPRNGRPEEAIVYHRGMFCGSQEEVQKNVRTYGDLATCDFLAGYFGDSLPTLPPARQFVFAFLDVCLVDSMKDCLRWIWPLLAEQGVLYTNDAFHMNIARLFFNDDWWQEVLAEPAPGLVGSGCGLPLGPRGSSLGYTRKSRSCNTPRPDQVSWLHSLMQECQV